MAKRAPKVASPSAQRLKLRGVMVAPDPFGRVRVLLMSPLPSGAPDHSAAVLRGALRGGTLPYELHDRDRDDVIGAFWAVPPARHAAHWRAVAAECRGREVGVEVTVRPFVRGAERGWSLDLAAIEPHP